jgi:hypothetical protein
MICSVNYAFHYQLASKSLVNHIFLTKQFFEYPFHAKK